jgi:hypothetical protein
MFRSILFIIFLTIFSIFGENVVSVDTYLRQCDARLANREYIPDSFLAEGTYEKKKLVTVHFRNKSGKAEEIQVYDPSHKLMKDEEFNPGDRAKGGTSKVGFYSIDKERRLCFKQAPEIPAYELAVRELYKTLFPEDADDIPIPASEVIVMNGQVFLVSQFIKGETLENVLLEAQNGNNEYISCEFDVEKFQRLAFFCFLINPEDCRPQNCIVRKCKNSNKYQLVLIDNERAFCREVVRDHGSQKTRVHCVLFCFEELMRQTISTPLLKERSIAKNVSFRHRIEEWIRKCRKNSEYIQSLGEYRTKSEQKNPKDRETDLTSSVGEVTQNDIIKKVDKITGEEENLRDIFGKALPQLDEVYGNKSKSKNTLLQALENIKDTDWGRSFSPTAPRSSYTPIKVMKNDNVNEISEKTGKPKKVYVHGYWRDGIWVKEHYRSKPA